jgi:hypothetical protein
MRPVCALLLLLAACARPPGGRDGRSGRSCTVEGGSGSGIRLVLTCTDGTRAVAPDLDGERGDPGDPGAPGADGADGQAAAVRVEPDPSCDGGLRVTTGVDADLDGQPDPGELNRVTDLCLPPVPCTDASGLARLPAGAMLASKLDLRRFQLAGCTRIGGDLRLGGDDYTQLNGDLVPLSRLEKVEGDAEIAWVHGSLSGLEQLHAVDGSLLLHHDVLDSLTGLENLREIGKDLVLGCGLQVKDISALLGLQHVGGDVRVSRSEWGEALRVQLEGKIAGRVSVEECPR